MRYKIITTIFLLLVLTGCDVTDTSGINFVDYNQPRDNFTTKENVTQETDEPNVQFVNNTQPIVMIKSNETIVGAWNVQIFGKTKAQNTPVYNGIVDVINDYDLIAIQEIRDISGLVIEKLGDIKGYDIIYSERLGRSSSKEQYAVLYNPSKIRIDRYLTYEDVGDKFEREPFIVGVTANGYSFTLVIIHVKPTDAVNEIKELETVMKYARTSFGNSNVIVIGDLNADCSYYKGGELEDYKWLINDSADTTVGNSNCAYDRIIIMNQNNNWQDCGVDKFEDKSDDLVDAMSDHYALRCVVI